MSYAAIGLDRCKDKANLGGVLRAAGCYGAALVAISGERIGKYSTDTMKAYRRVPCIEVADLWESVPFGAIPVVVRTAPESKAVNWIHPPGASVLYLWA